MKKYYHRGSYGYMGAPEQQRGAMQNSKMSIAKLLKHYNLNQKTIRHTVIEQWDISNLNYLILQ